MKSNLANNDQKYLALEKRKPIWKAISAFYLDTELQDYDYTFIAEILQESKLSMRQLKDIDRYEVLPVLKFNLISVTGVWTEFNEKLLFEHCSKYFKKRSLITRFTSKILQFFYGDNQQHWQQIEKYIAII